jgi:adenosylcobinamide-GDP ribazoletransferase
VILNWMGLQWNVFLTAIMFYTRIPCPPVKNYSQELLDRSVRYFPLVGWMLGAGMVVLVWGMGYFLPDSLRVALMLAWSVLATGAFHEDGFADTCDGLGGGWERLQILQIMKDSRIGVFGALGLILLFMVKFVALLELLNQSFAYFAIVLMIAHVLSRFCVLIFMQMLPYCHQDLLSKVKPIAKKVGKADFLIASSWVMMLWFLQPHLALMLVCIPIVILLFGVKSYLKKWIGGYTGDVLGALQQVVELIILIYGVAVWNFI